jgi:uncharacterized protein YbaP (TraB family)
MIPRRASALRAAVCALLLVFASGCFAPFPSPRRAEAPARPSMWAVRSAEGELHFHLLGSVHLGTERMLDLGPQVEAAFANAQELVLEADLTGIEAEAIQQATERYGVLTPPETLADRVSPETLRLLDVWAGERGLSGATLHGLAPWLVTMTFALIEFQRLGFDPALGVDKVFQERATRAGLPVAGLETLEFQFRMLAELPPSVQELMLRDSLERRHEFESEARAMIEAWARGDDARLAAIVFQHADDPAFGDYYARVLFDRNRHMAEALAALVPDGRRRFVILGAAHMLGRTGVPALLAKRGFQVVEVQ